MDFRVLICDNTSGSSTLTDDDLETFQDETTIIFRADRRTLDHINGVVGRQSSPEWFGRSVPEGWPEPRERNVWPAQTTSFDLRPDDEPITEALKKSVLGRETSTTQLVSLKYGKMLKNISAGQGSKRLMGIEKARRDEQIAMMCELNQNRDVMDRSIFSTTQNRIKLRTLIGTIDMPGWLDSLYSLVRESKHRDVCAWKREDFLFYELGVLNLYESFKYVKSSMILTSSVVTVDTKIKQEISKLRQRLFQRQGFERLRALREMPKAVGGQDKEAPEGITYGYLAVFMKILQISAHEYLEKEEREIRMIVEAHVRSEFRTFDKFKITRNSKTLLAINEILNRRDTILGISRTHRTSGNRFFFDTESPEYVDWRKTMVTKSLDFTTTQYAHWIMKRDNKKIVKFFKKEVNFGNFLRRWRIIPRDMRLPNVYGLNGTRESDLVGKQAFKAVHAFFLTGVLPLIFQNKDDLVFAKILEMTLRAVYNNQIPQCDSDALSSFMKVLIFAMSGDKLATSYGIYEVRVDEETAEGAYWEYQQDVSVPAGYGITLTERSKESCRIFMEKLMLDQTYDAGLEKDVLVGEIEDVHGLFPENEITNEWIAVPRFVGYKYRLTRGTQRRGEVGTLSYAEALISPQTQYLRHDTLLLGGCRQIRDRVHDRTYSNRLRQFTPQEAEGNHPCLIAKLVRTNDVGLGSALLFFLFRFIDQDKLVAALSKQMVRNPERYPEGLRNAIRGVFPNYNEMLRRTVDLYEKSGVVSLDEQLKMFLFNPGNCFVLDVTLEDALVGWFGLRIGVQYFLEIIRTTEEKSRMLAEVFSTLVYGGTSRDLFVWNIQVILVNLFVPDFLEYKRNVPIFVMTKREIVPVPVTMQTYTEGNASLNALRYFDSIPNENLLKESLSEGHIKMLEGLRSFYLNTRHWSTKDRVLEGRYTVFQSWLGLGCEGVKEKLEVLVPTARPGQSHFKILIDSDEMCESDIADVESVLDEGEGLGDLRINVNADGVDIKERGLKVKRYKHLVHNEMLDGSIIRLEAASRFDTYMPAKLLN
uniref:Outer capsid protein VP2 n=1 Tax=Equine encephalosis virus 6 TaxID=201492 RepID=A0A7U1BCB4_9REOV|nr:VP2 [Equine encephalosis virus 6]